MVLETGPATLADWRAKLDGDRSCLAGALQNFPQAYKVEEKSPATIDRLRRTVGDFGDMDKAQYLAERQALQADLAKLTATQSKPIYLDRIADFLRDLGLAWEAGDQEQRNRLATELFEAVWVQDGFVYAVTPRPDIVPFFDAVYAEATQQGVHPRVGSPSGPPLRVVLDSVSIDKVKEGRHLGRGRDSDKAAVFYPDRLKKLRGYPVALLLVRTPPGQGDVL